MHVYQEESSQVVTKKNNNGGYRLINMDNKRNLGELCDQDLSELDDQSEVLKTKASQFESRADYQKRADYHRGT